MSEPDRDAPDEPIEPIEQTDEEQDDVELHGDGGLKGGGHRTPVEPPAIS